MPAYFTTLPQVARFSPEKAAKQDLAAGRFLFTGLNCFEPGQVQRAHVHDGADKFYYVVSGTATIRVGEEVQTAGPGTLAFAPAGVTHGVEEVRERTIMLVAISPPPSK